MAPQYQDIISNVNITVRPEDERAADRYYKIAITLKALMLLSSIVVFICFPLIFVYFFVRIFMHIDVELDIIGIMNIVLTVMRLMCIICLIYILNKRIFFRKIKKILLVDCDPVRMLSCLTALLSHSNRTKESSWGLHFYNICVSLYYAGRFEDARKILTLFPKYCPDDDNRFKYALLSARLSYYEKDEAALYMHCQYLSERIERIKKKDLDLFYPIYQEAMQYPILLAMEKDGAWQQAYDMLRQTNTAYKPSASSMLSQVKNNYLLYRMAKGMGDEQCATYHRDFVLQNGGSLWYKREIENFQK